MFTRPVLHRHVRQTQPRLAHSHDLEHLPMHTVLLVEDNQFNRMLMQDIFMLDDLPAELVSAESAEEALELAPVLQPALILLDVRLPGIDGLEATRRLKQDPVTKDIPVWALTAHAMLPDRDRALAAGCAAYITKPFHVTELVGRLREFLAGRVLLEAR